MSHTIIVKYEGKCAECGASIGVGSEARYYGRGILYGTICHPQRNGDSSKPMVEVKDLPKPTRQRVHRPRTAQQLMKNASPAATGHIAWEGTTEIVTAALPTVPVSTPGPEGHYDGTYRRNGSRMIWKWYESSGKGRGRREIPCYATDHKDAPKRAILVDRPLSQPETTMAWNIERIAHQVGFVAGYWTGVSPANATRHAIYAADFPTMPAYFAGPTYKQLQQGWAALPASERDKLAREARQGT